MNKLKQKTVSLILALIMLFGTILSTNSISYAEKATRTWIPGLYYHSNNKGFYGQFPHIKIGGEDVFCVQPSVEVQPGEGYTSTTDVRSIMNQKQKENIELIHHYGYTLSGKSGKDYAFTQLAIWRELGHSISIGTSTSSSNLNTEYTAWRNKIQEKNKCLI